MTESTAQGDQNQALLVSLMMMLSASAMQQLGKLVNPETNKTEVNLEAAQMSIDMIEMLKQKMQGNLNDREARMIDDILSSLQMNYVEEKRAAENAPTEAAAETAEAGDAEAKVEAPSAGGEKKDPKFHKSYSD